WSTGYHSRHSQTVGDDCRNKYSHMYTGRSWGRETSAAGWFVPTGRPWPTDGWILFYRTLDRRHREILPRTKRGPFYRSFRYGCSLWYPKSSRCPNTAKAA